MESPDQASAIVSHPPYGLMQLKVLGNALHSSRIRI